MCFGRGREEGPRRTERGVAGIPGYGQMQI
jgi:hypothetical protein